MKFFITPELLYKYIDGQCSDQEVFMLHQWYDSFQDEDDIFENLNEQEQEAMRMLMLEKFKASVKTVDTVKIAPVSRSRYLLKTMYTLTGIAATLLLVWAFYFNKREVHAGTNTIITTATEVMLLNNQTSSIYKQLLPDGSTVWLSPKSQLQFPKKFMGTYREVKLTGEAFFEVTKNISHPFIVNSGGVVTKVWGTSFRIKSLQNVQTEVSVVTGKVSVKLPEKDDSEIMLYPQQKATYLYTSNTLTHGSENQRSGMRMWGKVTASFDNVPLDNVLTVLRNQYGIRIYTDDKELGKYLLKADFTNQNLPSILEMLQNSLNAGYTIDDTQIVLYRKTN